MARAFFIEKIIEIMTPLKTLEKLSNERRIGHFLLFSKRNGIGKWLETTYKKTIWDLQIIKIKHYFIF